MLCAIIGRMGGSAPNPDTKTVAVVDYYGLPSTFKNSSYFPSQSWNRSDNPHVWVVKDVAPMEGGTAIYIYPHDGHSPTATHIHLFTWVWRAWFWEEDNILINGPTFVGDIYLRSYSNADQGNCALGLRGLWRRRRFGLVELVSGLFAASPRKLTAPASRL